MTRIGYCVELACSSCSSPGCVGIVLVLRVVAAILTYNTTYAPPTATAPSVYQEPQPVATPLMVRFTAEFSF